SSECRLLDRCVGGIEADDVKDRFADVDAKYGCISWLVAYAHNYLLLNPPNVRGRRGRVIPLVVTPAAKRDAVAHLLACHGTSEPRASRVIAARRMSVRYRATRADGADLRKTLRELANPRRRCGYRRPHILLRREGVMINRKTTPR